jgi:hypothetical protein
MSKKHNPQPNQTNTMNTTSNLKTTSKTGRFRNVAALFLLLSAYTVQTGYAQPQKPAAGPAVDIHTAALTGNLEALKKHIAAKTGLNSKDPMGGSTALLTAALFGKTEAARLLIDAGADLNLQNNDGSTPLHTAAFFCRPDIVKLLLDKGADKTIKNKYGNTALQNVTGAFTDVKPVYDMMLQLLSPMGLQLDYAYVEKTRPEIASMLK